MSQHDQIINDGAGLAVRTDINAALAAIFSTSLGSTEPSVKNAGMLWFDTSVVGTNVLKVRDQTNAFWITVAQADSTGLRSYINPSARAHRNGSGAVGLTAATWTKVNFTAVDNAVGGTWLTTGNSLVVPRAGTYLISASAEHTNAVASTDLLTGISVGGAITTPFAWGRTKTTVTGIQIVSCTGINTLGAGATLQLVCYSTSASTTVADTNGSTYMVATMVAAT